MGLKRKRRNNTKDKKDKVKKYKWRIGKLLEQSEQ